MRNSIKFLLVIVAVIVVFLGINRFARRDSTRPVSVGLKWLNQAQFAGYYIAQDKHFYQDVGLDVRLAELDSQKPKVIDQVLSGELNFGIVTVGDFLHAIDSGAEIKAVGVTFQYSPTAILVLTKSKIYSPQDLRYKVLGIGNDTEEAKLPFKALLEESAIPLEQARFKAVGQNQVEALISGSVDAVAGYRTSAVAELNKLGVDYRIILPERYGIYLYNDIVVARSDFIAKNPRVVRDFMDATTRGWQYAFSDRDDALAIVLAHDNSRFHDMTLEAFILDTSLPLIRVYEKQRIGSMTPAHWDATYALFRNHDLIGDFDIHQYYVPENFFLKK